MEVRSPFYVVQDFLSPLMCEEIVDDINFLFPDFDIDGIPQKTVRGHERSEEVIFQRFTNHVSALEEYYNVEYRGTHPMTFEWYPQACPGNKPHCENSDYINKQWTRTRDRDFTCILFLSNYQERVPFDSDFEVSGGKLEFMYHGFGFNPQRGTLIVFPSGPNFINATTVIEAGDLYQVRFHVSTMEPFVYTRTDFPGNYSTWFEHVA